MAAVIAPPAAAGAPTVVTTSGTVPADNLANSTLLANDPFVISHPPLPFIFSVVIPGGGHQTASLAMGLASRTWTGRLTLNNPGYNQPRFNLQRLHRRLHRRRLLTPAASVPNWSRAAISLLAHPKVSETLMQRHARLPSQTPLPPH